MLDWIKTQRAEEPSKRLLIWFNRQVLISGFWAFGIWIVDSWVVLFLSISASPSCLRCKYLIFEVPALQMIVIQRETIILDTEIGPLIRVLLIALKCGCNDR
ncbi:hypothetical protein ACFX1R_000647 [Malus domestica]